MSRSILECGISFIQYVLKVRTCVDASRARRIGRYVTKIGSSKCSNKIALAWERVLAVKVLLHQIRSITFVVP